MGSVGGNMIAVSDDEKKKEKGAQNETAYHTTSKQALEKNVNGE